MTPAKVCFIFVLFYIRAYAQRTDGIVFSGTTTTTTTTTPKPTTKPTTKPPPPVTTRATPTECRCIAVASCPVTGIDVRIVNQGVADSCPSGQIWCCGLPVRIVTSCGVKKITNAPAQPTGTAQYGEFPWHVAILAPNNSYIGSGVLINQQHILTAAHKVAGNAFKVRLGDWDGTAVNEVYPYQEYNPLKTFVHPAYNSQSLQNDIAVVRLSSAVPLQSSPNINTACLPTAAPAKGSRCWVTGWGKNEFGANGQFQNILKKVDVPIVDANDCETRLRSTRLGLYFNLDKTSFMCAGGEVGKDACTGDGGAPLVCSTNTNQWQVVGLVTWGIGCAMQNVPGVYINVFNYLSWINQQLAAA